MLAGKPKPALGDPAAHNLDVLIAPLQARGEISIRAVPRELVVGPRRRERRGGLALGRGGREVGQAREVRVEEGAEETVVF
jgi:hypothetical protein